ncbi:PilN family type IVB pilus formation outer membrane protein [Trinickia fusca]|nr:PilN family type IVB pilus formation outer membrane protein [Trinickia fusca]
MSKIQVHDGVYLGAQAVKTHAGQVLPARFEQESVRLVSASPLGLKALGELIAQATGIPVSFSVDVFESTTDAAPGRPGGGATRGGSRGTANDLAAALNAAATGKVPDVDIRGLPDHGQATPMLFSGGLASSSQAKMHVNYRGSLSGFLNQTAAYFDINWTYRDGRIEFERNVTRTFTLITMPTVVKADSNVNAGIGGSGSSGGGGSGGSGGGGSGSSGSSGGGSGGSGDSGSGLSVGASQSASITVALDFWKDLEKTLQTILGGNGKFSASTSMSSITVTAPPSQIARVADYIESVNKQLLRQVTVKVEMYSVNIGATSDWQFSLAAAFQGGGVLNAALGSSGLGKAAAGASDLPAAAMISLTGGKFKDSKAILNALDSLGNTSIVTTAAVTTMSGQPVPLQVGNTKGYVAQLGTTVNDSSSSSNASASMVSSGFSLTVLPKVLDDGEVLLQYSVNLSALAGKDRGFDSVDIGNGQKLQVPNINQRSFIQEAMIRNGATLVLAGFEALNDKSSDNGIGSPDFKLLGGSRSGSHSRQILVICITPVVLDHSGSLAGYN